MIGFIICASFFLLGFSLGIGIAFEEIRKSIERENEAKELQAEIRTDIEAKKKKDEAPKKKITLEHQESEDCWCCPRVEFSDPLTGQVIYVHNEIEDSH